VSEIGDDRPLKTQAFCRYKGAVRKECLTDGMVMVAHKRVVLYTRISTIDKEQGPETQVMALREDTERRGLPIVTESFEQIYLIAALTHAKLGFFAYPLERVHFRNVLSECLEELCRNQLRGITASQMRGNHL
jgi:hypothetical protein